MEPQSKLDSTSNYHVAISRRNERGSKNIAHNKVCQIRFYFFLSSVCVWAPEICMKRRSTFGLFNTDSFLTQNVRASVLLETEMQSYEENQPAMKEAPGDVCGWGTVANRKSLQADVPEHDRTAELGVNRGTHLKWCNGDSGLKTVTSQKIWP